MPKVIRDEKIVEVVEVVRCKEKRAIGTSESEEESNMPMAHVVGVLIPVFTGTQTPTPC